MKRLTRVRHLRGTSLIAHVDIFTHAHAPSVKDIIETLGNSLTPWNEPGNAEVLTYVPRSGRECNKSGDVNTERGRSKQKTAPEINTVLNNKLQMRVPSVKMAKHPFTEIFCL